MRDGRLIHSALASMRVRLAAYRAGDLRLAMICVLADRGPDAVAFAEKGTEAWKLAEEGMTARQAREVVATHAALLDAGRDALGRYACPYGREYCRPGALCSACTDS